MEDLLCFALSICHRRIVIVIVGVIFIVISSKPFSNDDTFIFSLLFWGILDQFGLKGKKKRKSGLDQLSDLTH